MRADGRPIIRGASPSGNRPLRTRLRPQRLRTPGEEGRSMHDMSDKQMLTRIIHAGQQPDPATGAVSVPIYQSSTFAFRERRSRRGAASGANPATSTPAWATPPPRPWSATSPTWRDGCGALGCATGMAAVNLVYLTCLGQGSHVVATESLYGPSRHDPGDRVPPLRRRGHLRRLHRPRQRGGGHAARDEAGLHRDAGQPDPEADRHRAPAPRSPTRAAPCWPWTTPSPRPTCRTPWSWAPTSSCTA